jgi:hypothetical protein
MKAAAGVGVRLCRGCSTSTEASITRSHNGIGR